jgi:parallel beta helix pectate lyase-like protein
MSPRSFRRERSRRVAADTRRAQLRRRRAGLAAGAAVGAFALAAPAAQAANFVVNTKTDAVADGCTTAAAGCTLRDAFTDAVANSEADVITFQSGLTGTVLLTMGQLQTNTTNADSITVQGPGAGLLAISGDADDSGTPSPGDSRIFNVQEATTGSPSLAISGLTLTGGYTTSSPGAAIYLGESVHFSLTNATVTGNLTTMAVGGAIGTDTKYSKIDVSNSTISDNTASVAGGIESFGALNISNSKITGNHATGGSGGGIGFNAKYGALQINDSTISGNSATAGGGLAFSPSTNPTKYEPEANEISNTTISGNSATLGGAGMLVAGLTDAAGSLKVTHSTISGNPGAAASYGGGILFGGTVNGDFQLVDSTISGNSAGAGAGVGFHTTSPTISQLGSSGSASFYNSTIASNAAVTKGGGFYLDAYDPAPGPYTTSATIPLNSTIVGNNTAASAPNDLDQADAATTGGFELFLSLVEVPGDAVASQAGSITGSDPQLGALGNNGGPTRTNLPAASSPAIDAGGNILLLGSDQRGDPRIVDLAPADATDGTDIGAVERAVPPPPPGPGPGPVTGQPPGQTKKKCKKHKKHKRSAQSAKKKCKKKKKKG